MGRRSDISAWAAAAVVLGAGCAGEGDGGVPAAFRREVNTPANVGSLVVSLDRTAITTADVLHLELVAECPVAVTPEFPERKGKWGQWTVVDVSQAERSLLGEGRVGTRRVYTLEPYLAGDYVTPAFSVGFSGPGKEVVMLEVEAIPVAVASVLEGDPEKAELVGPFSDLEVPGDGGGWWWWVVGGGGGVVIVGIVMWFLKKGEREVVVGGRDEVVRMVGDLDGLLGVEKVDVARLSALAGRVPGVPEELLARIDALAFSESGAEEAAVRGAAAELREIVTGEKGGAG